MLLKSSYNSHYLENKVPSQVDQKNPFFFSALTCSSGNISVCSLPTETMTTWRRGDRCCQLPEVPQRHSTSPTSDWVLHPLGQLPYGPCTHWRGHAMRGPCCQPRSTGWLASSWSWGDRIAEKGPPMNHQTPQLLPQTESAKWSHILCGLQGKSKTDNILLVYW